MSLSSSSNLVAAFIDLATYDHLERYLYGGPDATAYFVKKVRKSTWFTVVPVALTGNGRAAFGQTWSANVSRAGDYLVRSWLRVAIPSITLPSTGLPNSWSQADCSIRWSQNLGHNLIREASLSFNDLVESRLDSFFLDFWAAFTVPSGKYNGYQNMIGNVAVLNNPVSVGGSASVLPAAVLNVPLPFSHFRETGWALPTAALPYNDIKLNFNFRNWYELLIIDNNNSAILSSAPWPSSLTPTAGVPQLTVDCWAEYALVSNGERTQMGKAPRDLLIEQVQTAPLQTFNASSTNAANNQFSVHFAHSVKTIFFGVLNSTNSSEWSNYTSASPAVTTGSGVDFTPTYGSDPIAVTSLYYENTQRLSAMGSDYFSFIQPYYTCPTIPSVTGYHVYNYTLDILSSNAMGSTNFGKLTNVIFSLGASADAVTAATATGSFASPNALKSGGIAFAQAFQAIIMVLSHNVVRASGGVLGFPAL